MYYKSLEGWYFVERFAYENDDRWVELGENLVSHYIVTDEGLKACQLGDDVDTDEESNEGASTDHEICKKCLAYAVKKFAICSWRTAGAPRSDEDFEC